MHVVLQGKTFTGLSQHPRKFPNVASEHHFLCSGVTCSVNALAASQSMADGPTNHYVEFLL
jgi:hypothetical protein